MLSPLPPITVFHFGLDGGDLELERCILHERDCLHCIPAAGNERRHGQNKEGLEEC